MPRDPALNDDVTPSELDEKEWRSLLDPVEFRILRESGTERAGTGRYLNEEAAGAYHCAGCGLEWELHFLRPPLHPPPAPKKAACGAPFRRRRNRC